MSDNDHQHGNDCGGSGPGNDGGGGKGPDTNFLDFELDKVMYEEATSVVREAYRELLKDAAKRHIQATWGKRIEALAQLAVDEALADTAANFVVQAQIAARNEAKRALEDKVKAIIEGGEGDDPEPSEEA